MEEETQFVPFAIHIAQSDAAWLAAWAPDPRALGAHAMGLAALRGLLAEDMPRDGQPLGGEIQHARALIDNARATREIPPGLRPSNRRIDSSAILGDRIVSTDPFHGDTAADFMRRRVSRLEERLENIDRRVENVTEVAYAVEKAQTETAVRLNAATTAGATFRKRVAALLAAIYRPQAGDQVDIIDRANNTIITTEVVQYVAADGPAVGNHDEDTDFIHRADPHRYILPHVEV